MLPLEVSFLSEQVSPVISVKEKAPFSKFYTLFIGVRVCVCGQKHVDHLFLFSVPFKNGLERELMTIQCFLLEHWLKKQLLTALVVRLRVRMKMTIISNGSRACWLWQTRGKDLKCSDGLAGPFVFVMVPSFFIYTQRSRLFYGDDICREIPGRRRGHQTKGLLGSQIKACQSRWPSSGIWQRGCRRQPNAHSVPLLTPRNKSFCATASHTSLAVPRHQWSGDPNWGCGTSSPQTFAGNTLCFSHPRLSSSLFSSSLFFFSAILPLNWKILEGRNDVLFSSPGLLSIWLIWSLAQKGLPCETRAHRRE